MRCIMVNTLKLISIIVISCFISFSAYGEIEKGYVGKGVVIASCNNLEDIGKIAALDQVGELRARKLFISLIQEEKCGVHMPPIVVRLEKLEDEYIDSDGREIQVWKIFQNKLWALIEKNKVHINKPKKIQV